MAARLIDKRTNEVLEISRPVTSIGRTAENDICVAGDLISRQHAIITNINGTFHIEDLSSRNGTRVNDTALTPNVRVPIYSGNEIWFGLSAYYFVADAFKQSATVNEGDGLDLSVKRSMVALA
jgi:pSer/pThr/pTyr-binding forkhead associated (FHA) protein